MISIKLQFSLKPFHRAAIVFRSYSQRKQYPFRPFTMPKDNVAYLQALQKQRRRQKVLSVKYPPSNISIQVIGNGSRSESRSVVMTTDHTNYVFNCGEGMQRLATEHHSKLSKLEHIFVTKPSWDNMGGIPGLLLTVQDTGVEKVYLHGPEGTEELLLAIDNFVNINQLDVLQADTSQSYTDHTMTIEYLAMKDSKSSEEVEEDTSNVIVPDVENQINFYSDRPNNNGKRPRSPSSPTTPTPKASREIPLVVNRINTIMAYICKIHPKAGAINIDKLNQFGVARGPDVGKLKAGEDITLPNGNIVKSVDVVDPTEPGPLFIVLECPNEDWIDVVVENPAFLKYQEKTAEKKELIASYIIHFTPSSVLKNTRYQEWMSKFGKNTEHLVINEDTRGYASESIHKMQHQLHLVNGQIFPFFENRQNFANVNNPENEGNAEQNHAQPEDENSLKIRYCKTLNGIHLRRHKGFDNREVQIKPRDYVQEALAIDGLCDAIADLQTELNNKTKTLGAIEEYPKIVFLGTGCSIPNKVRNTSGILLQLSEKSNVMLDCGEGTVGQLIRFFGEDRADDILKHLNAVYVSHLHADHHLGFIGLLKQRKRVTDEPLFLVAPHEISQYLTFYHRRFESISKGYRIISNKEILLGQSVLSDVTTKEFYERTELSNINTVYVKHCPSAYGVAITLKDGRKICYSGDTVPCDNMVKLASDSFLLIHEATMEDGLEAEAKTKRHSTISQAVTVGMKANVNFTMLTHFSQRYSKIPLLPSQGIDLSRVGIAYDFMQVRLSELPLLPMMYPSLCLLFSEFRAQLDEKAAKRQLQLELAVDTENVDVEKVTGRL